jgi:hypothetical protein
VEENKWSLKQQLQCCAGQTFSVQADDILDVVFTALPSGNTILNPTPVDVTVAADLTINPGEKCTLNVPHLDQVVFAGNSITVHPTGQLQLAYGPPITVLPGTLYVVK